MLENWAAIKFVSNVGELPARLAGIVKMLRASLVSLRRG